MTQTTNKIGMSRGHISEPMAYYGSPSSLKFSSDGKTVILVYAANHLILSSESPIQVLWTER